MNTLIGDRMPCISVFAVASLRAIRGWLDITRSSIILAGKLQLKPNEVYTTCGKRCNEDCTKSKDDCLNEQCQEGCFCDKGYKRVRDRCVPEEECECPFNEVYKCGTDCDEDCGARSVDCWKKKCSNRCHCVGNYKRIDGVCQAPSQCKCPSNEEYKYGSKCSDVCGKSDSSCSNDKHYFDCFCKDNFKRVRGFCVSDTNCPCPKNEEYVYGSHCEEECSSGPSDCKDSECYKDCFCQDGYRRVNGLCVPDSECSCGENEEYSNGNECFEDCTKTLEDCVLEPIYKRCNCKLGYKRMFGKCVPDSLCKCNENESYKYGSECEEKCSFGSTDCSQELCYKGCFCNEGYVRLDGKCVPGSNCGCGENEEYVNSNECSEDCSKTLDDCRSEPTSYGCYCARNYKRINGTCVPDDNCPCPQNEEFDFTNDCLESCSGNPESCDGLNLENRCKCKEGYRRILGTCVKDYFCPCEKTEKYKYGDRCRENCQPSYDDCPEGETFKGCFCKDGYVRVNGTCQPFDNCVCNENEEYSYSNQCLEKCEGNPENRNMLVHSHMP
uniref:TIL domain-containing protein n=1 Tax=Phlebotomus papatasi TaxID=29031 RepID=A0A1B0D7N3_PHLPP